jgi:Ca2+-binding RTX toxin-like protein
MTQPSDVHAGSQLLLQTNTPVAASSAGTVQPHAPSGLRRISGTNGDDLLRGGDEDEFLFGLNGNDTLDGLLGNDNLSGGSARTS